MPIVEYPEGAAFPGVIGRTADESSPAWPAPPRARKGAPSVLMVVLDDTGFGHLGCFGSPIETPSFDALAAGGLRYTNMHTTALCSPTRACILTGRNHHSNGMACITEFATGYPGYDGLMPFENGMLSEMLLENGYNTFCVGKWHLTPAEEGTPAGPYHRWPLGRGFERFYGFLGGETNQWFPDLIYDNHSVSQPKSVEEGYHLTEDLADKAIQFILDAHVNAPDKPFFLYYATGAAHAPHQVAPEWSDKYKGKFDMGWDKYREVVFANQKKLGIFPADAELSRHDPDVPAWDTLSADQKKLYARFMEVFAGFLEHADYHFGRILKVLEEIGELDNTLIMVISDNGASSEGGAAGAFNEMSSFNNHWETVEEILPRQDQIGGPASYNHYPWGWAWAGNTPFRRWKKEVYRGGCTDNLIVHWPAGIKAKGELRPQFAHAIDMVPTVLEALGFEPPHTIRGVTQAPIEGVSFAHTFTTPRHPASTSPNTTRCSAIGHLPRRLASGLPLARSPRRRGRQGLRGAHLGRDALEARRHRLGALPRRRRPGGEPRPRGGARDKLHRDDRDLVTWRPTKLPASCRWTAAASRAWSWRSRSSPRRGTSTSTCPGTQSHPNSRRPAFTTDRTASPRRSNSPRAAPRASCSAQGTAAGGYSFYVKEGRLHYVHNYVSRERFHRLLA